MCDVCGVCLCGSWEGGPAVFVVVGCAGVFLGCVCGELIEWWWCAVGVGRACAWVRVCVCACGWGGEGSLKGALGVYWE